MRASGSNNVGKCGNVSSWLPFGGLIFFFPLAFWFIAQPLPEPQGGDGPEYDVVVYGGTSAGVVAAVQAARMGHTAVLIAPRGHLGGMSSSGLGWTDTGNKSVIGGLSREFYRRIKKHYDNPASWRYENRDDYRYYRPEDDAMWTFEPHVAERIFDEMVREAGVPVLRGERLQRPGGVVKRGTVIESLRLESGREVSGRMFIDCSYEGDLMAEAGVTYTVGRESNRVYGETINGVATRLNYHNHRFIVRVSPFVRPDDPSSGLLPGIDPTGPGKEGEGDHRVQAYNYRLCLTDVPENRVPFTRPEGFREIEYELLFRNFEAGDRRLPLKIDMMPNRKTDVNNNGAVSTDYIGMNYDYPDAGYARRAEIERAHEVYVRGLMWVLANHPRVPVEIRRQVSRWGWAKDEFVDNDHFPFQIYVREARRMVGEYVMTEHDCRRLRVAPDSVGLGSYNMDSHNVQRYVTEDGTVQNEGDVQESPGGPYVVSYRSLLPKRNEATNLLVPVCLSASHAAYGSIRMEPVFMILGQSAATAACLALERGTTLHDLDYAVLRKRLLADGQVLDLPPGAVPAVWLDPAQLPGVVVDDTDAELAGAWKRSTSVRPFVGLWYLHDGNSREVKSTAKFVLAAPRPGDYVVRIAYSPHGNRATNVLVRIRLPNGAEKVLRLNQRRTPADPPFQPVATARLNGGDRCIVEISNEGADGYVIVDAVQLLPK